MILIGQYDSSYVRRVAIALKIYDIPFEHRPWSVFGDGDQIREINPLMRVPTLVLEDGEVLVDSASILDYLDGLMPAERRLFPTVEPERRSAMKVAALATGLADKGVGLFYELRLHSVVSDSWVVRLGLQIKATLAALETDRAGRRTPFWFGDGIGHGDIAVACAWRHVREAHPHLIDPSMYPALAAHCARLESLPVFQEISQPFIAPA